MAYPTWIKVLTCNWTWTLGLTIYDVHNGKGTSRVPGTNNFRPYPCSIQQVTVIFGQIPGSYNNEEEVATQCLWGNYIPVRHDMMPQTNDCSPVRVMQHKAMYFLYLT